MILYLTYWFPRKYLARNVALFMTATALAGVVGGPVSGVLLEMNGLGGLSGWQWLFVLEGLPAVFLGIAVFICRKSRRMHPGCRRTKKAGSFKGWPISIEKKPASRNRNSGRP